MLFVPTHSVEYHTGTDQIPYHSSPFQPWPPLAYIPNVPSISQPLKHQGKNVFGNTQNPVSEFVKIP